MKKIIIFLFALLSLNRVINAQTSLQNGDIVIDYASNYSMTYNRPIIRANSSTEIISYHEEDHHGVFTLLNGAAMVDRLELEYLTFVLDFEVVNGCVYFCGEKHYSSSNIKGIFGKFNLTEFTATNPSIDILEFDCGGKPITYFKKMEMFFDPILMENIIVAIGHSYKRDPYGNHYDENDFLTILEENSFISSNPSASIRCCEFPNETYHDVIETANFIVLSGELTNQGNTLAFRRIDKTNYNIPNINDIYTIILPHLEPLTYLLGEGLDGTDMFITSTFAEINNTNGTILRTYDATIMDELYAQFIPCDIDEKTQPYELEYMDATNKILLLQYSTSYPETKIFYIDPMPNNSYSVYHESFPNNDFYSLAKYTTDSYLAIGFSATNIVYADKYTQLMAPINCVNKGRTKSVIELRFGLKSVSDSKSIITSLLTSLPLSLTKSSKGLSIYCF